MCNINLPICQLAVLDVLVILCQYVNDMVELFFCMASVIYATALKFQNFHTPAVNLVVCKVFLQLVQLFFHVVVHKISQLFNQPAHGLYFNSRR